MRTIFEFSGENPKIVACAAERAGFAEFTEAEFDELMSGFARGPFFVLQEAARNLRDHGRIISISSVIASMRPPFTAPYAGAKSALEAFSAVLAGELAAKGITVNVVSPGGVETKMLRDLPKDFQDTLAQRTPLGIGQPRDIAAMVAYLVSDQAGRITNENIRVDGGIR